ncbi:Crotonase superfamily [Trinorchestia longiramus]|nr:Crotonase superfamily [Trinorchestia longiramus]
MRLMSSSSAMTLMNRNSAAKLMNSNAAVKLMNSNAAVRWMSSSAAGLLDVSEERGVRYITLTDSRTRNSLSQNMLEALYSAVTAKSSSLRCIVLRAEGPVFSAGHNLKEIHSSNEKTHRDIFECCNRLMLELQSQRVPVIAQVDGIAAAAGCQLVAACDIVVASDTSSFSTPGASVGIFCSTPGVPLVRCVPRKVSALMLLTGTPITAHTALSAGLVSVVVSREQLQEETERIVEAIVSKSEAVLALGKKFMYHQMQLPEEEAYRLGAEVMVKNINMLDGQEGISSFVNKRKPKWTHEDH